MTPRKRAEQVIGNCESHACGTSTKPRNPARYKYSACKACIATAIESAVAEETTRCAKLAEAEIAAWSRPGGHTASDGAVLAACRAVAAAHPQTWREAVMSLADRVAEFRAWARNRIDRCRQLELKFGSSYNLRYCTPGGRKKMPSYPIQVMAEAWAERMALQAALRIIEGED